MEELKLIPPLQIPPESFPESEELPEGVKTVKWKDTFGYDVEFLPDEMCIRDSLCGRCLSENRGWNSCGIHGSGKRPVSYTHLDVYKRQPLTEAPSGIIGLETSLSLGIMNLVDTGKLTLLQLLERMSLAPARLYHLDAGYLAEGGPADLILFDEKELWKAEHFHSKSSNTPFLGWEMK